MADPMTAPYLIALDKHEADALRAFLDIAEPTPCIGGPEHHDAAGYAIPSDVADYHAGYCPGDLAALDRIRAALDMPPTASADPAAWWCAETEAEHFPDTDPAGAQLGDVIACGRCGLPMTRTKGGWESR